MGCSASRNCKSTDYAVADWSSSDTQALLDSAFVAKATSVDICRHINLGANVNARSTVEMHFGEKKDIVEEASLLMLASAWNKAYVCNKIAVGL